MTLTEPESHDYELRRGMILRDNKNRQKAVGGQIMSDALAHRLILYR